MGEDSTFLGFLPKQVAGRPEWLRAPAVEEICSVATCISRAPDEYVMRFDWNSFGFYDTEDTALACIPDDGGAYTIFAYRLHPWIYDAEGEHAFDVAASNIDLPEASDLEGYELLGYDVVEKTVSDFFECSPLSCNRMAEEIEVNRYCLADTLDRAREIGVVFGDSERSGVEPSPYFVVEVWRRKEDPSRPAS